MKQLRALSLKHVFAGFGALTIFGTVIMSLLAVLLAPGQASAQAATFEWVNIGTIKQGTSAYYDTDPFDGEKGYGNIAAGNCSAAGGPQNVPMDRIVVAQNDNESATRHFVNPNAKTGSGALTCAVISEPITINNAVAAGYLFYRSGDTVYTYDSNISFVKTNTINSAEIFTRSGEQSDICPDIVVRQGGGQWLIFPMAGADDNTASPAKSEVYQDSFGFPGTLDKCRVAPSELNTQFHVAGTTGGGQQGPIQCDPSGGGCIQLPQGGSLILSPNFIPINGDDGYVIVNGVGGAENAPPANSPPPGSNPDGSEFVEERSVCTTSYSAVDVLTFKWLFCDIIDMMTSAIGVLEDFVTNLLVVDTAPLESDSQFHQVWSSFRALALGIIVVIALVMVIAQATGVEAFSAYTVRSVLARFALAAVFIPLSFSICKELIEIVNGITTGMRGLIYAPFNGLSPGGFSTAAYGLSLLIGLGGLAVFGPVGLLSFVGTGLLSIGLTSLLIIVIHGVIYILVLISPIAIALGVLPNTRPYFQFLQNTFVTALLALIIVSFVIPGMRVIAIVFATLGGPVYQIIAIVCVMAAPFVAGGAIVMVRGAIGNLVGAGKGAVQGAFGGLKNFRAGRRKQLNQERMEGRGKLFGSNKLASAYRRAGSAREGGLSLTSRGRARYRSAQQKRLMNVSDQMLEQDKGFVANDDDANALALQNGMTRQKFVDALARTRGRDKAREALGALETSYGAQMGTSAMQMAAFRARAASATGYLPDKNNPNAHYAQFSQDAAQLISKGLVTSETATAMFKQNKARADQSGISFTVLREHLNKATERYNAGATGEQVLGKTKAEQDATVRTLRKSAIDGTAPGALVGGRSETVAALAPQMLENLQTAIGTGDHGQMMAEIAKIAGAHDLASQVSRQSADILVQQVLSKGIATPSGTITVKQFMEDNRSDPIFGQYRREYASAAAAAAGGGAPTVGGPGGGPPPGVTPP